MIGSKDAQPAAIHSPAILCWKIFRFSKCTAPEKWLSTMPWLETGEGKRSNSAAEEYAKAAIGQLFRDSSSGTGGEVGGSLQTELLLGKMEALVAEEGAHSARRRSGGGEVGSEEFGIGRGTHEHDFWSGSAPPLQHRLKQQQ
jgi:hypothetical protein